MAWEDYQAGMYGRSRTPDEHRDAAYELLSDASAFTVAMEGMLAVWPISAEHRLTGGMPGALPWLGAAACMWAHGVPEHCTRAAWWLLTEDQMSAANDAASAVRTMWLAARVGQGELDF